MNFGSMHRSRQADSFRCPTTSDPGASNLPLPPHLDAFRRARLLPSRKVGVYRIRVGELCSSETFTGIHFCAGRRSTQKNHSELIELFRLWQEFLTAGKIS